MAHPSTPDQSTACPLDALAAIAAQSLIIALPESPQGKPFIDKAETGTPAAFLRAMRRTLNLTQREFGILLSPNGLSPISPSVICQLESALQTVPPLVVTRAVAVTTAVQLLGEYLAKLPTAKDADAARALKVLGPGCIDMMQPFFEASPELSSDDAQLVREYLTIVTKRRHTTGGSRPGARGPYRKLSKLSARSLPAADGASPMAPNPMPPPIQAQISGESMSPRAENMAIDPSSGLSTPSYCSTPGSLSGSSRPRSPASTAGYDSNAMSDRYSDYASSYPGTPTGRALTPIQHNGSPRSQRQSSENASLEVMMALRRLQEENESLMQENKRLRAMVPEPPAPEPTRLPAVAA